MSPATAIGTVLVLTVLTLAANLTFMIWAAKHPYPEWKTAREAKRRQH